MKSQSPRHTNALSMMPAALLCAATVHAAPKTLEMPREKQLQGTWCWAAVSTMAVNSFPMKLPNGSPITQRTTVILKEAQILNETDYTQSRFDSVGGCTAFGSCGGSHDPFLYNARATRVPPGKVLTKKLFAFEIVERKRPVIITWDYGQSGGDATPAGLHLLIITGYNPSNGKVRVFDPWPVDSGSGDDPRRHKRERWIPYNTYRDPVMDMGQPVTAVHDQDLYQLRRFDEEQPAELDHYPKLGTLAQQPGTRRPGSFVALGRPIRAETFAAGEVANSAGAEPHRPVAQTKRDLGLQRVDFTAALAATRSQIDAYVSKLTVTLADGTNVRGKKRLKAATAFPLITLNTSQVLINREKHEALFERKTSVLLVPVVDTRTNEVIDSFLIYNQQGDWKIGGYANTEIAEVLVQQRKSFTNQQRRAEDFFVVSVPEQAAFYFAHGAPGSVQLVSVENQGRDAQGKDAQFTGAGAALDGLARSINEAAAKK
jgi:hypothetical protein